MLKLYIMVRNDGMNHGQQAAQAVHLAVEASRLALYNEWRETSNTVVLLTVDGQKGMLELKHWMDVVKQEYSTFSEPDQGYRNTGYATIVDSDMPWSHISKLNLMMKYD